MATQRKQDEQRALGLGAQYGGAYQSMLGQRYGNLSNIFAGSQLSNVPNPFGGLWEGMLVQDQYEQEPNWWESWGAPLAGGIFGVAGGLGSGGFFNPSPAQGG